MSTLLRAAFATLFGLALLHKVRKLGSFQMTVRAYLRLSPWHEKSAVIRLIAFGVVAAEACVVATVAFSTGSAAAIAAGSLLMVYACAMFANLRRGNAILDCGCSWGQSRQPVHVGLVGRNGVLMLIALAMAVPVAARPMTGLDLASIAAALAVALALYAGVNRLLALMHSPTEVL